MTETTERVTVGRISSQEVEAGRTFWTKRRSWAIGQADDPKIGLGMVFGDDDGNVRLVVTAWNAVVALNPTDPLSAAQHLEALVKAASELLPLLQVSVRRLRYQKPGDEFWPNREEGDVSLDAFEAALSRVTGKP